MDDAIEFIKDVLCAPYSIPIGLINSKKPLKLCSDTTKKELDIKDISDVNRVFSGRIGTLSGEASSFTDYNVLSKAIQNILRDVKSSTQVSVSAINSATINCDGMIDPYDLNYSKMLTQCWDDYQKIPDCVERLTKKVKGIDGKFYDVPVYGCCPVVDQNINLNVDTYEKVTFDDYEKIFNEIEMNVENTLNEQGSDRPSRTRVGVLSSNTIKSQLIANIQEKITSTTNQNLTISQELAYRDQYGMCEQKINENGIPISVSKRLKQTIDVDVLAHNIIHSSAKIIMNNKVDIESKTTLTIQRLTNYRIIVVSLLWNVIVLFLLSKMMTMFMDF